MLVTFFNDFHVYRGFSTDHLRIDELTLELLVQNDSAFQCNSEKMKFYFQPLDQLLIIWSFISRKFFVYCKDFIAYSFSNFVT